MQTLSEPALTTPKLGAVSLKEAIEVFKLEIARLDYSGARYVRDKQVIADSLNHSVLNDNLGYITDPAIGRVWIVHLTQTGFRYSKVDV
jgi:hypothetical protein